ncbi:MAG: Uroporphyrinogen decarboxylase (URO-D) [bacterium ADurb.Bin429]|nr:MAG: Uroporphyrinogen decarboxylase (URO-D) [bacterium ADurb.Bin429]
MNDRQRCRAVLTYQPYDHLPVVHFGFWPDTLQKWAAQGHLTHEEARTWADGNPTDAAISAKLGFDFNYYACYHPHTRLKPAFESRVVREFSDGSRHVLDSNGAIVLQIPGAQGIPAEIDHLFKGRKEWDEEYKPRFQFDTERVTKAWVRVNDVMLPFDDGGLDFLRRDDRDYYYGLHCGSLYGQIRDFMGVENSCYLQADDEELFDELIETVGDLCYQCTKAALESGAKFDFAHFWEDICFKNGPLISPAVFAEKLGPQYKRITDLVKSYGIEIISLDCDGLIDALIPTWLANGVNTMFPIEVGTWNASIAPWRARYGREIRGVGGMNKVVFAYDRAAIDAEVERLKPLVELGGFIPCPDHRIAPDAEWDNVRYYCDRLHAVLG